MNKGLQQVLCTAESQTRGVVCQCKDIKKPTRISDRFIISWRRPTLPVVTQVPSEL